jgi:hypothetical protein
VTTRVRGLTRLTLEEMPRVCHECVWWQSKTGRRANKDRWTERVEDNFGPWGALYYDDDGRVIGSMQYGPAELFPRAFELPAGPPSEDAVLVTCAYLLDRTSPWVLQSLFLAAIGEARDRAPRRSRPSPTAIRRASRSTSVSRYTRRFSRATSSRTSAFGRSAPSVQSSSSGSSSAA